LSTAEKKVRIAIIVPGGIGTGHNNIGVPVLERLIKLLAHDFQITIFSLFKVNENYFPDGFELISISTSNAWIKIIKFFAAFKKSHREKNFQAVHGFWVLPSGFLAVVMGKLFGIKSIVSVLGGDAIALPAIHYGQLRNPLYRRLIFWALNQADKVSALTQYLVNNLRLAGFTRDNIHIIPWGIDTEMFLFHAKPLGKPIRFLHIGNMHPVKDQETLLRAFKLISDKLESTLTIIGEGVYKDHVQSLIHALQLQDKVTILDPLPYDELPGYYLGADVLLHTSLSEGQSEVVTESMSAGVLVCGTKVGLMHDLPECCISVDIRDYQLLAHHTLQVIANPQNLEAIKQRALQWATDHSILWTAKKIKELYTEA